MLALARCGDVTGAAKLADEFGAPEHTDAEHHLQRARCYAQLTRVVSPEEVERYRVAGLDALERAADAGYGDPFRVRAENDLDPLHDDPRFEAIVARISTDATPTP